MSKPLPYSCIKKMKKIPSLHELNKTLNKISHADKIRHLFIANIMYHLVIKKTLFNEVYTPIFEKSKLIKPYERSTLELLSVLSKNEEKYIINTLKHNTKTYSTMKEKKIIPLYAKHLHFLLIRADWLVTKIYEHCTLEQARFKKDFVTMNENVRQKAKTPIEQNLYKIRNSANFNIDCQNNIDNCRFEPIYDQISEISFIKKYTNIFGNAEYKYFASIETMHQEIEQLFNENLLALDPNDLTFEARKYSINIERAENLDALVSVTKHEKKKKKSGIA